MKRIKAFAFGLCILGVLSLVVCFINIRNVSFKYFMTNSSHYTPGYTDMFQNSARHYLLPTVALDACDVRNSSWKRKVMTNEAKYTSHVWVPVDSTGEVFVYSAYFDVGDDGGSLIRVIGMGLRTAKHSVLCVLQMAANSTCLETRPTSVEIMPEHHSEKHSALFVDCRLPQNKKPFAVSVTGIGLTQLKNRLVIQYRKPLRLNLTACFPCLHSTYNNDTEIIQTIEMDKLLGVEHFVIYNNSIGTNVDKVLKHYQEQGILEVRSWNLPNVPVHYFGQLASVNDCLYSHRGISKYVIVKDVDEIIVPYKDKTLTLLLIRTENKHPSGSPIMFLHTFYLTSLQDDKGFATAEQAKELRLYLLLNIRREKKIWKPTLRSKVIYRPESVIIAGIHFCWKLRKGFQRVEVPVSEGLVHHYRSIKVENTTEIIKDDILRIYGKELIENFKRTSTDIHNKMIDNILH